MIGRKTTKDDVNDLSIFIERLLCAKSRHSLPIRN